MLIVKKRRKNHEMKLNIKLGEMKNHFHIHSLIKFRQRTTFDER